MFLSNALGGETIRGFPRVSGDVPIPQVLIQWLILFSPRERGCSEGLPFYVDKAGVFPA